jgi:hypothetical protein
MKTIFLFIPNYVYASDLLRTHFFLQELCAQFKVIIFIPPDLESENCPYPRITNAVYVKWSLQYRKFWFIFGKFLRYSLIRKYDFEPVVKRSRDKGMQDWRRRILRVFSYALPRSLITPDLFTWLEMKLVPNSKRFQDMVREHKPAVILTPTPGFNPYCAEALILAKKARIQTGVIDFSWDNLHNGGIHFRRPDFMIVWNDIIRNTAVQEYNFAKERIGVSGTIRFDQYYRELHNEKTREDFLISKGLDPSEKTILLTTVTQGNYAEEQEVLKDILSAREQGAFAGFPNIYVRMHPKEDKKKFTEFFSSQLKNFHIEGTGTERQREGGSVELIEEDLTNLKYTLKYCDVNINYVSTITLEALAFDKPVVNINYPEKYKRGYSFRHYKPIVDIGAVRLAQSFDDLVDLINKYLENPMLDQDKRGIAVDKFIPFRDGLSSKRCVSKIAQYIK